MIEIPFTKLHGAENDFLFTWTSDAPNSSDLSNIARRICARNTGIGADGWMLVEPAPGGLTTRLFNSDGSEPELSGNGTRCAAAFALVHGLAQSPDVLIETAAGPKHLRLITRRERRFSFEMDMGQPLVEELQTTLILAGRSFDATLLNVGNPQCVLFVDRFPDTWLAAAREAERDPRFPQRTNVSFVRPLDLHSLEVLFFERGAGETRSSGTGSTGAAVAAILRGVAESPVEINAPAGTLHLRWEESVFLTGPAEVIGEGRFFLEL
ncbi:MAG: diaminopimelate epimerase [Acidobacteriota bacterium]|nr:diaminopimelate epimerase [Acidobacteriota bacterium]